MLIVGSGAGGAPTAAVLAEAGLDVLVVEEGPWVDQGAVTPFSLEQMERQYRNGGLTVAARSSVDRLHRGTLRRRRHRGEQRSLPSTVRADTRALARGLGDPRLRDRRLHGSLRRGRVGVVGPDRPGRHTPASRRLRAGAALGWAHDEIPRWMTYPEGDDAESGQRQSMTRTYLPRAIAAGARVLTDTRVDRLIVDRGHAFRAELTDAEGGPVTVDFADVIVCAGAIHSPALLQRSGLQGPQSGAASPCTRQ
ncbi:MAG: NAD(P)-dependent oxidoreductase [Ilumatobacteraceae bacterium]